MKTPFGVEVNDPPVAVVGEMPVAGVQDAFLQVAQAMKEHFENKDDLSGLLDMQLSVFERARDLGFKVDALGEEIQRNLDTYEVPKEGTLHAIDGSAPKEGETIS